MDRSANGECHRKIFLNRAFSNLIPNVYTFQNDTCWIVYRNFDDFRIVKNPADNFIFRKSLTSEFLDTWHIEYHINENNSGSVTFPLFRKAPRLFV